MMNRLLRIQEDPLELKILATRFRMGIFFL